MEVPEVVNPFTAVLGMLGGNDPGDFLASVLRQASSDAVSSPELAAAVAELAREVRSLRDELSPVLQAFGVLQTLPKFRRAMSRTDL